MALFTDGNISTVEDLTAQDTGLMAVAGTEGIDLERKLDLAQEEVGVELAAVMPRFEGYAVAGAPPSPLESVVVTTPLRLWHTFRTLELVYRDAYNNQLNDRYRGKWQQYRELAQWAEGKLLETGVGMAANPVPRAASPVLSLAESAGAQETTVYARAAWVNRNGEEGAASAWELMPAPAGFGVVVTPVEPPAVAAGWNVYAGPSADRQTLQNASPLTVGQAWVQSGPITTDGRPAGTGQSPSFLRSLARVLPRG